MNGAKENVNVAVLFARADSNYKRIAECDVWDLERDARKWSGCGPIIAHPPCRAWGRLRHFAKPRDDEKDLARFAVQKVRAYGGVLEHPESSQLWIDQGLPKPGQPADQYGGWTLPVEQFWWGHRAQKKTWLYIVGCAKSEIPAIPLVLGKSDCVIRLDKRRPDGSHIRKGDSDYRKALGPAEREHTPPEFAAWLVALSIRCKAAATSINLPLGGCV